MVMKCTLVDNVQDGSEEWTMEAVELEFGVKDFVDIMKGAHPYFTGTIVYPSPTYSKRTQSLVDCPYCPNQGWYIEADFFTGEPIQIQCEWCDTTENSVYNYFNGVKQ